MGKGDGKGGLYIKESDPVDITKIPAAELDEIAQEHGVGFNIHKSLDGKRIAKIETFVVVPKDKNGEKKG